MGDDAIHPCKKFLVLIILSVATGITFLGAILLLAGGSGATGLSGAQAYYGGMCSDLTDGKDVGSNTTSGVPAASKKCPQPDPSLPILASWISPSDTMSMLFENTTCDYFSDDYKKLKKDKDGKTKIAQIDRGCKFGNFIHNPSKVAKKKAQLNLEAASRSMHILLTFVAVLFTAIHAALTNLPFCNKGKSGLILVTAILIGASIALCAGSWVTAATMIEHAGSAVPCTAGGALAIDDSTYFSNKDLAEKGENGLLGWEVTKDNVEDKIKDYKEKWTTLEKYWVVAASKDCTTDIDGTVTSGMYDEFVGAVGLAAAGACMSFIGLFLMMMITGWMFKKLNDTGDAEGDNKA